MLECRPFSPRAIVADLPTELLGPFMVELKAAPVLMDDGTVVAPRRFERHVTGTHVGEDSLGIALQRIPESAAAGGLDQKTFARGEIRRPDLSRREFLSGVVVAQYRDSICQSRIPAVKTPRRADRSLHAGINRRRLAHVHALRHAQPAAEFARPDGILAQRALFDNDRALRLDCLNG